MSVVTAFDFVAKTVQENKAFTSTTGLVSISSQDETPIILFRNPGTESLPVLVTHFLFGTDSANARSIWRTYAKPTVTADGTALIKADTYIKTTSAVSAMEAFKMPTVSDNGEILNMVIAPADTPSRGVNRFYWIDPGCSLLVTIQNSVSNADSFADIYWLEGRV